MKLSEKTLELNICAQVSAHFKGKCNLLWFGLTQRQEARAGFDACTKLNGRLVIFQFKASNHLLKSGSRKFLAPHDQMMKLRHRTMAHRSIFYAFPLVGNTHELKKNSDLLAQTWLLDVAKIPTNIGLPTKTLTKKQSQQNATPTLRKNGCHNVYVEPYKATIHSDPVEVDLEHAVEYFSETINGTDGAQYMFDGVDDFVEFTELLGPGARGVILY